MKPLGNECPNCGANIPQALTTPKITCEYCFGEFANPNFDKRKVLPPVRKDAKGFPPSQQTAPVKPEPFVEPAKDIGGSLIRSFVGAISWYILVPLMLFGLFVFGCCFFSFFGSLPKFGRSRPKSDYQVRREQAEQTKTSMRHLADELRNSIVKRGEIYDDAAGNLFLKDKPKDAWQQAFRYEQISSKSFLVRSGGKDKNFGTTDDSWHLQTVPAACATVTPPKVKTAQEAETLLRESAGYYRKSIALDWIINNHPELADGKIEQYVEIALESSRQAGNEGQERMARLIDKYSSDSQPDVRAQWLWKCMKRNYPVAAGKIVDQLAQGNHKETVETFFNIPIKEVNTTAAKWLEQWKYSQAKRVELCLKNLDDPVRREKAFERLGGWDYEVADKEKVAKALLKSVAKFPSSSRVKELGSARTQRLSPDRATAIFKRLLDKKMIPDAVKALAQANRFYEGLAEFLASTGEEKAMLALADNLFARGKGYTCRKAIVRFGTRAESHVWPHLNGSSEYQLKEACELLGTIGSSDSIPKIKPLTGYKEKRVREAANEALARIRQANREPFRDGQAQ